jgi:hypothetical protein
LTRSAQGVESRVADHTRRRDRDKCRPIEVRLSWPDLADMLDIGLDLLSALRETGSIDIAPKHEFAEFCRHR